MNIKEQMLESLISNKILRFGNFTTKSGRVSPYYFDFGKINSSKSLKEVANLYALKLESLYGKKIDNIFGPSYKGISLAIMVADILSERLGKEITYTYNRKEYKPHGEKGYFLGYQYQGSENVVIVEDVITSGTSLIEVYQLFSKVKTNFLGILVGIDRQENAGNIIKATEKIETLWSVNVESILKISDILSFIESDLRYNFIEKQHPGITVKIKNHLQLFATKANVHAN